MLFNSFVFPVFFIVVYSLYISLHKRRRVQNLMLLIASYVFYGYWDWRFLSLLFISTIIDFNVGRILHTTSESRKRKLLITISVVANLSILGAFKYFGFFADNFIHLLHLFGLHADEITLNIILPLGISFYTFQTMSYTIDIYRGKLLPTRSILNFALFVSFFPQLVAGPIERASNLIPQIESDRKITATHIDSGLFLILWGYFKKVVIADNLAIVADQIFNGYTQYDGIDLVIGVLAFSGQIYSDFSGYSDIARGLARLMGFDLMVNFKLPYFALSPSDFWLRWHVSLSSWLREYLYIPLGGNRLGNFKIYRNLTMTMLLGGLWHGASWNFVFWGLYHGAILILFRLWDESGNQRHSEKQPIGKISILIRMMIMFVFTVVGWVFFRCRSIDQIVHFLTHWSFTLSDESMHFGYSLLFFTLPLMVMQYFQHTKCDLLIATKLNTTFRVLLYTLLMFGILVFGVRESVEFIYFQF